MARKGLVTGWVLMILPRRFHLIGRMRACLCLRIFNHICLYAVVHQDGKYMFHWWWCPCCQVGQIFFCPDSADPGGAVKADIRPHSSPFCFFFCQQRQLFTDIHSDKTYKTSTKYKGTLGYMITPMLSCFAL